LHNFLNKDILLAYRTQRIPEKAIKCCVTVVQDHPGSLKLVLESLYASSYWSSTITMSILYHLRGITILLVENLILEVAAKI